MTNEMAARVLTYNLRLPIYGDLKLEKDDRLAIFKPGILQIDCFGCGKKWYHFQQQLMVSKTIVKLFS